MKSAKAAKTRNEAERMSDEKVVDFGTTDLREQLLVPEPVDRKSYLKLKKTTPARLGIWRSGPRYLTETMLRFRADHAAARDAVFTNVSEEFIDNWGILEVSSRCRNKEEYLTRPDLGRQLDGDNVALLKRNCLAGPRVQILIVDGLSSTAVETNSRDTYESLVQGLKVDGIETGTPVFVRYGRVPVMDTISEIIHPEVTVTLVGERPGLATAESLGCYMVYQASPEKPESARTVVSNIHRMGTPAVEAGAQIADIVRKMLEQQTSGIALKL